MKTRVTWIVMGAVCLTCGYGAAEDSWKTFASKAGGFSVQLPMTPKEEKLTLRTLVGAMDVYLVTAAFSKECTFIVSYSDYPEAMLKNTDEGKILDGARDGAVRNVKGTARGEKKITLQNYPGREIIIDEPQGSSMKCRIYLVKNRLYQEVAVVPKGQESAAGVTYFLDSFKLLAK